MPFLDEDGVTRLVQDLLPYFSNRDALDDVFANFATIETSSTASKAYSVNDLLVKDDILYRVTSNIASGATITVGTNVVALQIEDIYDLVNTKLNISDYRRQLTWGELEDVITWGDLEGDTGDTGTTTYTEDYHLAKPSLLNQASIVPINNNMDLIDAALADKLDDADYRKAMTWGEVGDKYNWGVLGTSSQTTGTTYTDTLGLEKPGNNSTVDVDVLNDNYDVIDDAIENTQESMAMIESHTARSNHAIGSYFMLDNVLHKARSAIASGETITSGTNATPITLEQALTALNTSIQSVQDSLSKSTLMVETNSNATGNIRIDKIGRICIMTFKDVQLAVNVNNGTGKAIGTISDSSYRTAELSSVIGLIGNALAAIAVETSGAIVVWPKQNATANNGIDCTVIYTV